MKRKKSGKKFMRVIWAEGLSDTELKKLKHEVELALSDPDHSIVTNYEVHWDDVEIDEHPDAIMVTSAPGLSEKDIETLVAEVERARSDPDYAIVANYPVHVKFVNHIR